MSRRSTMLAGAVFAHRWLSLVLAVIALLLTPSVSLAHANLERSDPPDGAILGRAPAVARLWFTEEIEPGFSRAVVATRDGAVVSEGSQVATDDARELVVTLQPNLGPGWYTMSWQALARIDGHLTRGTVTFGVGVSGPPPDLAAAESAARSGGGSSMEIILRGLILLTAIVVVGAFAFWSLQGQDIPPTSTVGTRRPKVRILAGQWALAELAWLVFVLANVVFLANAVEVASDVSTLDDLGPPLVRLATQSAFGQLWLARMALAGGLGVALLFRGTRVPSSWDRVGLALGAGLILSFSLASHSAAVADLAPVAVANDWLHFAAVTVWIGGLFQLAVVLAAGSMRGPQRAPATIALVRRFAAVATAALTVVALTGLGEAAFHVGTPANLVGTRYGQVVLVKTLLLVPLLAVAAMNRQRHPTFIPLQRAEGETHSSRNSGDWATNHAFGGNRPPLRVPGRGRGGVSPAGDQPPRYRLLSKLIDLLALPGRPIVISFAAPDQADKVAEPALARSVLLESLWAFLLVAAVGLLTSLSPP